MTTPIEDMAGKVRAFLDDARAKAKGGLTVAEFGSLLVALLRLAVAELDAVQQLAGPEKKAIALEAVAALFDSVAVYCVPTAAYPVWMAFRPLIRSTVLALASGALESLLPLVRAQS